MKQTTVNELIRVLEEAREVLERSLRSEFIYNVLTSKNLSHLQKLMVIYIMNKVNQQGADWVNYMDGHEHFTQKEVRDALGISNKAVRENFIVLQNKGMIFRGDRPFSWCITSDLWDENNEK